MEMLNYSTIEGRFLVNRPHECFCISVIGSPSLVSVEALPAVCLLKSSADIILSAGRKQVITLPCISKEAEGGASG